MSESTGDPEEGTEEAPDRTAGGGESARPAAAGREVRVAVVDGDAGRAATAALAIERADEAVTTGLERTAEEALEAVEAGEADCLVVTDGVSGVGVAELVERLRASFAGPIVAAVRDGDERTASAAVAAGADEYVPIAASGGDGSAGDEAGDGDGGGDGARGDDGPGEDDRDGAAADWTDPLCDRVLAAVDRVRRERRRPPYRAVVESLPAGACLVRDGRVVHANARLGRLFGRDPEAVAGASLSAVVAGAADDPETATTGRTGAPGVESDGRATAELLDRSSGVDHVLVEGEDAAVELSARPVDDAWVVLARDVTDRRGRERRLTTLHRATREMVESESVDDIATLAVETTVDTLDPLAAATYLYDRADGSLRRAATEPGTGVPSTAEGEAPLPDPAGLDRFAWEAFVDGTPAVEDAGTGGQRLALPTGDHGVLAVVGGEFDDPDREFARTLATNVEVAVGVARREATILERTERLRERTETLDRLRRVDAVVRDVGQLLVEADSRGEVERTVCDRLAAVEDWAFAWIGERAVAEDRELRPRARSAETGYLEAVAATGEGLAGGPAGTALRSGETRVVSDVVAHPGEGWRRATIDRGYRSAASVPLVHEGREYGVLELYAEEPGAFDDEATVLSELGETIAHAMAAVERERGLAAGTGPELSLRLGDDDSVFARLAAAAGPVTVEGVVPATDGSYLAYLAVKSADATDATDAATAPETADGDSVDGAGTTDDPGVVGAVEELADRDPRIGSVRQIGEGGRFEVELDGSRLFERVGAHGGTVRAVTVDDDAVVRVAFPPTVDVRAIVDALREAFPDLTVLARRRSSADDRPAGLRGRIDDRLTDRQREVLAVAYHSGFFEWPRESTGEAVADSLGVAAPTFHKHVRTAERKVFSALLDPS